MDAHGKSVCVASLNSPEQHMVLVALVPAGTRKSMWDLRRRKGEFVVKCPISAVESVFLVLISS